MKAVLIDTGCIVSLLDRSERKHQRSVEVVGKLDTPLITCESVIAESCYLMRNIRGAGDAILANVASGAFQVTFDLSLNVKRIRELLKKYSSVPMDLADACLVSLAEEFETPLILTLDEDFKVYRWNRTKRFENLLD